MSERLRSHHSLAEQCLHAVRIVGRVATNAHSQNRDHICSQPVGLKNVFMTQSIPPSAQKSRNDVMLQFKRRSMLLKTSAEA